MEPLPPPLEAWMTEHVSGYGGPGRMEKFGFGQSNPTFALTSRSGRYVLRRKPMGPLLPKAHAIEREFRVLRALEGSDVPAPSAIAICENHEILGAPFYVMAFVEGRIFYDQRLPGLVAAEREAVFDGMNQAVARLHDVDPDAIGLSGFGRTEGFLARQVALWTTQYRASEGERIEAMERLIAWLPERLPAAVPARIFHGDLRLDNMVFHPSEPRVIALLDWELSTLGDPFADFAYHAMVWRVPADLFRGFADLDRAALGIPEEQPYLLRYCARTGQAPPDDWPFYLAFAFFRLAAILQGVWKRAYEGNASAANALDMGARARPLAGIGWAIASASAHG